MRQPLRGLRGQSMAGRKSATGARSRIVKVVEKASGSGTFTSPAYSTICEAYLWGGGAGSSGGGGNGGGGGAACYKRFRVGPSQPFSYAVGAGGATDADGGNTTLTPLVGQVLTAGGGKSSTSLGGVATGGDIKRSGGDGGIGGNSGAGGALGGAGGANFGGTGGGGGGAGFSDLGDLPGGAGGSNSVGSVPGGGGSSAAGAAGRLFVVFTRLT